jgi:hypothetical protein
VKRILGFVFYADTVNSERLQGREQMIHIEMETLKEEGYKIDASSRPMTFTLRCYHCS